MGLQQASPTGAGPNVCLKVMPIGSVTPSDGHGPGERTLTRLYWNGACGQVGEGAQNGIFCRVGYFWRMRGKLQQG